MQSPRKHPRTMEEAFGPYQRGRIHETYSPMPMIDKIILFICTFIMACLLGAIFTGII